MASFSGSQAIGAGFRLIGRHPLAVLAWAAAYVVLGVLPAALIMGAVMPDMLAAIQDAQRSAASGGEGFIPRDMLAMQARMMMFQPLFFVLYLLVHSVMLGAIYRAVLRPEDRAFCYLRLGRRELWLGLTLGVLVIGFVMLCIVAMIPVFIGFAFVAVDAARGGGGLGASLATILLMFAAFAAIVWVALRLSLALPMSFDEQRFALFESWALTRGQDWKLVGVAVVLVIIVWLIEMLVGGVMAGVFLVGLSGIGGQVYADPIDVVRRVLPWLLAGLPVLAIFGVGLYTVMTAPFADIYRQLAHGEAPPAA